MRQNRFVTFEGGEGSGKSTQARLLAKALADAGHDVVHTREPGGSLFAERIRGFILDAGTPAHEPLAEALVFYAARADHLARTIRPALKSGRWVVCDRFSDSTRVYQGVAGGVDSVIIDSLEQMIVAPTNPGLTLIFDVPAAEGLARARQRGAAKDPYESRDDDFHEKLRRGFLALAAADPDRCVVIDGSGTEGAVAEQVWAAVQSRMTREAV